MIHAMNGHPDAFLTLAAGESDPHVTMRPVLGLLRLMSLSFESSLSLSGLLAHAVPCRRVNVAETEPTDGLATYAPVIPRRNLRVPDPTRLPGQLGPACTAETAQPPRTRRTTRPVRLPNVADDRDKSASQTEAGSGGPRQSQKDQALNRLLTATLTLVFAGLILILPPIVNKQLSDAEHTLEKPLIGFFVAAAIFLAAAWRKRFAIGILAICLVVGAVQVTYYFLSTAPSRAATAQTSSWINLPVSHFYGHVVPINTPDVFGYATVDWHGSDVTLKLRSKTGTTQQGIYQSPPEGTRGVYFAATVSNPVGGTAVVCPLLFGISNVRNYFTFRVQDAPDGTPEAVSYQIIQNSGVFTSGFHALLLDNDTDIPYYEAWNILQPSADTQTRMAILIQGDYGKFFVDGRLVFQRTIDDLPNYTVAVGATVLANDLQDAANCTFTDVVFRAEPAPSS